MDDFAIAPRTDLLNFKCHTVTNGRDLRKSLLILFQIRHRNLSMFNLIIANWGEVHGAVAEIYLVELSHNKEQNK